MQINSVKSYGIYSSQNYTNFKQNKQQNTALTSSSDFINKQKTAAAGGGLLLVAAAAAAAIKNRNFVKGFNKIFRPYKNMTVETNLLKGIDLREYRQKRFAESFIEPLKKRAQGYVYPKTGEKYNGFPSNGYIVWGSESKAKNDFYEWTVDELQKAGVEIIDPKAGGIPNYDDVSAAWSKLFFDTKNGITPDKVEKQFKKDGKFKAFVVRNIDELCKTSQETQVNEKLQKRADELKESSAEIKAILSKKNKEKKIADENFLNDAPDTNNCASKYGLILSYKAKDISKLTPATIRTGRANFRELVMPYADESIEVWKNHLNEVRNYSSSSVATRTIEQAKEIFAKRGEKEFNEIKPYLEYDPPYEGITLRAPLKKWENWIEYMGSRKGVSDAVKIESFENCIALLCADAGTQKSQSALKNLRENPKFNKILDMMHEKYVKLAKDANSEEYWNLMLTNRLAGMQNTV